MQIESVRISNFRCFGPEAVTVPLRSVSAFVGANGCGKTALMQSLSRVFGVLQSDRTLVPDDFHLPDGKRREDLKAGEAIRLFVDILLRFPELKESDEENKPAVAECFSQMVVEEEGKAPFCRVRLQGTWTRTNTPEGDIEQKTYWVRSGDDDPADDDLHPMAPHERSLIHVHYVPASRDPAKQVRYVSGSMISRLFGAIDWSKDTEEKIEEASHQAADVFGKEDGVAVVHEAIGECWSRLHPGKMYSEVELRPVAARLHDLLRQVQAVFEPAPGGGDAELERLSDGLKSLFYLSLILAVFRIETVIASESEGAEHFDETRVDAPSLTVFAIEEPENHVAPHYLGRIIALVRDAVATGRAQALITSHSPSVMRRVDPREVRYMRLDPASNTALVNKLTFPPSMSDEYKYIREAVQAYPELYFSRLVVLGEGDSEEVVLPRLAEAMGVEVDLSFVSVVPLGGRHVNHFWKLLGDLEIPHVTLLDLDRERKGGGWGRIQYAIRELLKIGVSKKALLMLEDGKVLGDKQLDEMAEWDVADTKLMKGWCDRLEEHGVFFSGPLDFDFLALMAYPDAYKHAADGGDGPRLPKDPESEKGQAAIAEAVRAVLKAEGGDGTTYGADVKDAFFWYRYLFLGRGKPASHLDAMSRLSNTELKAGCPPVLRRLCKAMKKRLDMATEEEVDAE